MSLTSRRMTKVISYVIFTFCSAAIWSMGSYGQEKGFPNREIKVLVATAGSGSDLWARAWVDEYAKVVKVPVIVVNKGGGLGSQIDTARAKPDGYTLTYLSQTHIIECAATSKPPVDLVKAFVPIGAFGTFPTIIAVEKSSPFTSFENLIEYANKNPKKLKCGTAGFVVSHFNFELLKKLTKTDIVMVPFKGSAPAVTALLGNHVDVVSLSPPAVAGLLKAGRVRGLIATQKFRDFPDIPSFSEKGFGDVALTSWSALFGPSGIPNEIHRKLVDSFERMAKDPNSIKKLEALGYVAEYQSPEYLETKLKKDIEKITPLVKEVGIVE